VPNRLAVVWAVGLLTFAIPLRSFAVALRSSPVRRRLIAARFLMRIVLRGRLCGPLAFGPLPFNRALAPLREIPIAFQRGVRLAVAKHAPLAPVPAVELDRRSPQVFAGLRFRAREPERGLSQTFFGRRFCSAAAAQRAWTRWPALDLDDIPRPPPSARLINGDEARWFPFSLRRPPSRRHIPFSLNDACEAMRCRRSAHFCRWRHVFKGLGTKKDSFAGSAHAPHRPLSKPARHYQVALA
jgi:hypothetical protein